MIIRSMNDTRSEVSQLKQALSRTNSKNDKQECFSGAAKDYIGRRKTTVSGLQCQRWDSQNPHEHHYKESQFSDCSFCEARNYCRDPGDDGYLWCYTTDLNKRWEGCGIPWCEEPERNNDTHDCYLITEEDRFSGASDKQICESNSNRFEVVSDQIWPKCEECCCQIKDCFKTNCTGCYTGTWHRTQTGRECQRWDSQTPHKHDMAAGEKFQQDQSVTGAQNYCRDPSESGFLWCYTLDPNERWEKCGILEC
ncbi:plasminogen-like [Ruditapes philippinarum]|uniref:plasminogen-like n=1 Tax=Ruditapes philippinarum TaxID=129788 RepID=UPI00295AABC3|nr:plasminogen-like [Ruditapes philippinarum]